MTTKVRIIWYYRVKCSGIYIEYSKSPDNIFCDMPYSNAKSWDLKLEINYSLRSIDSKEDKLKAADEIPSQYCKR